MRPGGQDDAELALGAVGDRDGHAAVADALGLDADQALVHGVEQVVRGNVLLAARLQFRLAAVLALAFVFASSAEPR